MASGTGEDTAGAATAATFPLATKARLARGVPHRDDRRGSGGPFVALA